MESVGNSFFSNMPSTGFNPGQMLDNPIAAMRVAATLISPEFVRLIVTQALAGLDSVPDTAVNEIVAKVKTAEGYPEINGIFEQILGEAGTELNGANFEPLFQKLNSAPIKKEIFKLADHPKLKKIMKAVSPAIQERAKQFCNQLTNPEAKKCAETYLKKFKIIPSNGFTKIWECIKNFFQKLFCCCKKKEAKIEVEASPEELKLRSMQNFQARMGLNDDMRGVEFESVNTNI